jgi:hypothetical protein
MGAWSHEPFGNDEANDWAYGLDKVDDLSLIEVTLDRVIESEDYLEMPEACEAVAAVEVLAKLLGRGTEACSQTTKVDGWVRSISICPSDVLISKANNVLERILGDDSELRPLWEESGDEAWLRSMDALMSAINS